MSKRLANKAPSSSYLQRRGASGQEESQKDDLLSKEEEYKRLNDELEKKTAHLVYEAEQVLRENEKLLNDSDFYHKIDTEPVYGFYQEEEKVSEPVEQSVNYEQAASELVMPKAANDMSNEAQVRFLKAKLKVLQEEVDRYGADAAKKDEENFKLAQRCKELEEERVKQLRISNSHQTQMEKFKKLNEDAQQKIGQLETQTKLIKNENEQLKRDSKKGGQDMQQLELRLNRSLEEIEKLKLELNKQMSAKKNLNEQDKAKIDALQTENKKLNKQKLELIQAFKRQMKLIDNLKKQKMHLEASRLLQFSEQEFINALEWSPNGPEYVPDTRTNSRPPSGLNRPSINKNKNANKKIPNKNVQNSRSNSMTNLSQTGSNNNAEDETLANLENLDFGSDSDFN